MARRRFDESDDSAPARGSAAVATDRELRCGYCGETAAAATLASFGRCGACYAAFRRTLPAPVPAVPASAIPEGTPAGLRWAWTLRARHERGDRLTHAQVESYRAALRHRGGDLQGDGSVVGLGQVLERRGL